MEEASNIANVSVLPSQAEKKAKIELEGTLRCLSMLSWELSTKQVLALCDLSVSEALLVDEIVPSRNSTAGRLAHPTLKSLVTSSPDNLGLGLEWSAFYSQLRALVYQHKYHIAESDPREIVSQVDDVSNVLNRAPVDAGEFHGVKQRLLEQKMAQQGEAHATRIAEMADRQKSLVVDLAKSREHIADLQIRQTQLMEESAAKIRSMTRDLALNLEAHEQQAEANLSQATQALEHAHAAAIVSLTQRLNEEIESHREACRQAESTHAHLLARIEAGEFVEASKLGDIERKLADALAEGQRLEQGASALNSQLTFARIELDSSKAEVEQLKEQVALSQEQIESLEARVRDQIEQGINSPEFAVLQERLSLRKQENERLLEVLDQAKHAQAKMKSKARTLSKWLKKSRYESTVMEQNLRDTIASHQVAYESLTQAHLVVLNDSRQLKVGLWVALGTSLLMGGFALFTTF